MMFDPRVVDRWIHLSAALFLFVTPVLLMGALPVAAQHFDQIALEFVDGLGFLDATVRPDLCNDGSVVFAGDEVGTGADKLFVGAGTGLASIDLAGFSNLENVEIDNLGDVAWSADRTIAGITYRGIYSSKLDPPRVPGVYPRFTLYQGRLSPYDSLLPPARRDVALTSHGEIVYSSLTGGDGGLYKGPIEGARPLYQDGGVY